MKRSELKIIIKDCVKEILFEEGVLSSIVAEVALGVAQAQAQLDATREQNRLQAFEPYERLNTYGSGVMGLISGTGNPYQMQVTPNPTPLQTALGTASVLGGIFNPPRRD